MGHNVDGGGGTQAHAHTQKTHTQAHQQASTRPHACMRSQTCMYAHAQRPRTDTEQTQADTTDTDARRAQNSRYDFMHRLLGVTVAPRPRQRRLKFTHRVDNRRLSRTDVPVPNLAFSFASTCDRPATVWQMNMAHTYDSQGERQQRPRKKKKKGRETRNDGTDHHIHQYWLEAECMEKTQQCAGCTHMPPTRIRTSAAAAAALFLNTRTI